MQMVIIVNANVNVIDQCNIDCEKLIDEQYHPDWTTSTLHPQSN